MKLLDAATRKALPPLYSQENVADPLVVVKFFNPCGSQTWWAIEYDGKDTFFGYVDLGDPDNAELGNFSLSELESLQVGPGRKMGIERDLHFSPKPLSAVKARS